MSHTVKYYDDVFSTPFSNNNEEQIENLRNKGVVKYRVKTIKSGNMLECEIYPIWATKNNMPRSMRMNSSRSAQRNLNDKNAKKKLIRLTNTNFTKEDIWVTLTYSNKNIPSEPEKAVKDIKNYLRRLKRYVAKNNLPELKYIYVTEYSTVKSKVRVHHHLIMNFQDRDIVENMWDKGGRREAHRLQPDEFGLEGLARYIAKDPQNAKRWSASKNLKKPKTYISDNKISRRKTIEIILNQSCNKEIFEKIYKGYIFNDSRAFISEITSGGYVYARMRKIS